MSKTKIFRGLIVIGIVLLCSSPLPAAESEKASCYDLLQSSTTQVENLIAKLGFETKHDDTSRFPHICRRTAQSQCALLSLVFYKYGAFLAPKESDTCQYIPRQWLDSYSASTF